MKVSRIFLLLLAQTILAPFRAPAGVTGVLTSSDIAYVGAETVSDTGGRAEFSYGQLTGYVDGSNVLHFVMFGNDAQAPSGSFSNPYQRIVTATSTTIFTVGDGTAFHVGAKIHACLVNASGGTHSSGCEQTLPQNSVITAISGNQLTVSPPFSVIPHGGGITDFVYEEHSAPIIDVSDQGTWNQDPNSATTAPLFHLYDDPYNGKRGWWQLDTFTNVNNVFYSANSRVTSFGLYRYNNLYYITYYANYADNPGYHNLMIFDPSNDTSYGPFITSATDGDGVVKTGNLNCEVLSTDPTDSTKFSCGGFISGGIGQMPWGPNSWTGMAWPTTSTTGGYSGATLAFGTTRYLTYYYMGIDDGGPNHFNVDGSATGSVRSFRYPTGLSYIYETLMMSAGAQVPTMADPTKFSGVGSWMDTDRWGGMLYFRGTHKRGAIFLANIVGHAGAYNNADCTTGQHMWYSSVGNVFYTLSGYTAGQFDTDTYLVGNTSNVGIRWQVINAGTGVGTGQWCQAGTPGQTCPGGVGVNGDWTVGETIRGTVSGHTATVTQYHNNLFCGHNCDATNGFGATGPSVSAKPKTGVFVIYDPDDLDNVRSGTATDWQTNWTSVTDIATTYTYPTSGLLDTESYHNGFFQDPRDDTYFYTIAHRSTPGSLASIIYKWHISDTPSPQPSLWDWGVTLLRNLAPQTKGRPFTMSPVIVGPKGVS